jgi:hypothetical protein
MVKSASFEWGRCPCGGTYEHRFVEVKMTVAGTPVVMNDVPQGACPNCGGRVYKAEGLSRIEGTLKGEAFDRRLNRRGA